LLSDAFSTDAIQFEEVKAGQSDDSGSIKLSLSASVKVSPMVMQSTGTNAQMHDVRVSIEVIDLNKRITCLCLETQPFLFQEAHYQTVIQSVRMKTEQTCILDVKRNPTRNHVKI
jgi:hypothetical protein